MASTPLLESKQQPILTQRSKPSPKKPSKLRIIIKKTRYSDHKDRIAIIDMGREVSKLMIKQEVESKRLESKTGPVELTPLRDYEFIATPKSLPMVSAYRSMFRGKTYPFRMSTLLNMSASAGGIVNSTIGATAVQSVSDFISMAVIFEEFFVVSVDTQWMPNSRYNGPRAFAQATEVANLPIVLTAQQHQEVAYASATLAVNHYSVGYHSTGDPFNYSWKNVESPSSTVDTITATTQGWCSTTSGQTYTGQIQIISQSAPPGLTASAVLGTFKTDYHILFRVRA